MKKKWKHIIFMGLIILFSDVVTSGNGWTKNQTTGGNESAKLQQRIDFGNAYIMGQSVKSGAVYLMNRKQSEIKSMLKYREDYRQEILEDFNVQNLKIDDTPATDKSKSQ